VSSYRAAAASDVAVRCPSLVGHDTRARGRAKKSYVSRSYACRRSVCRSAVIASLIIAAAAVLRSFALPPTVCHAGRFSVCQCIAGGAVRRATSAVMRFCRGGGCGGCRGRVTCQPASMIRRICVRALQRCGKERNFDMQYKKYNIKYTTLIYIYSYRRRNTCTKCVCCVVCTSCVAC